MSQRTSGLYRIVQVSRFYDGLQALIGAGSYREKLAAEYIKPRPGDRVLDLGCGSGVMLPHLGDVDYLGIDLNPSHIERARKLHRGQGQFYCGDFGSYQDLTMTGFDIVICMGLLHHLNDEQVQRLSSLAASGLKAGGRFVSADPTFVPNQHPLAGWLAARDSGQCVRTPESYRALVAESFVTATVSVRHDLLRIPYSHSIVTATKQ